MSFAKKIGVAVLFVVFLSLGLFQFAVDPAPFRSWKIQGSVSVHEKYTTLHVTIHGNGQPVTGLNVSIMGHPAEDRGNGLYSCLVQECLAVPGSPLTVTMQEKGVSGQLGLALTAKITPVRSIVVNSPGDGAHIAADSGKLTASWAGGSSPYSLTVQEERQPNDTVYSAQNLAGTTHQIPLAACTPGMEYLVNVFCKAGKFVFDHPVDPASSFILIQRSPYVHIHVE